MNKNKKKRDTSFSKTWKVIDKHGLETIKTTWQKHGMYKTAEVLETSPWVIRYIVHREEGWTRDAKKVPHLVKAVQNGHAKATDFKTLDFSNVQTNFNSKKGETDEK